VARTSKRTRDEAAVDAFVENFSSTLIDQGFPRMPARVFVALLAADSGQMTAAELAERLQISPAAVSGGVRYLMQVQLASRAREPGSRRDMYRLHDDVWYEAIGSRDQMLARYAGTLRDGVAALGPNTPAGQRIEETMEFFDFMRSEFAAMVDRWRIVRDKRRRANS
jgi:DNA-binding transcriptional regulator GbsR (MarR family)